MNDTFHSYGYDAERRLKTVDGSGATYTFGPDGERVRKDSGGSFTEYVYFGDDVIAEKNGSGWTDYVFANGQRIAMSNSSAIGSTQYYHQDHLGTARMMTGSSANVISNCLYAPFGEEVGCSPSNVLNHYKFTGKERDAESGLDYFGARYYGSSMGRFTSPDPKGISIRHLLNPQKFNKYAYVLNNPLNMVDPNGLEEITITYRTFIPQQSVTVLGQHFGGDNRGFSTAANASSRTSITVRIETDPSIRANPIISVTSTAGASTKLDANGNAVKTATATTGLPTATGTRDANGSAVINIQQDTKNPLSPAPQFMTPGISANLNVTVPQDASSATVNGTASQFPAQELNVTRADGNTTAVEQISPAAGATPFSLLKPDAQVNATKQTPQCSTDSNGKKVCN